MGLAASTPNGAPGGVTVNIVINGAETLAIMCTNPHINTQVLQHLVYHWSWSKETELISGLSLTTAVLVVHVCAS